MLLYFLPAFGTWLDFDAPTHKFQDFNRKKIFMISNRKSKVQNKFLKKLKTNVAMTNWRSNFLEPILTAS
jgi:hypothetical protein